MKKIYIILNVIAFVWISGGVIWAQQTRSGTITDENGLPLPGATVIVENTNRGVTSDFDGNFAINAADGEVLLVSYVGYSSLRIPVAADANYSVALQPETALDEVIVTAFGTSTKESFIGQAYSYRAWAYYRLITHFAKGYLIGNPSSDPGVPIIFATEAPFESAPRASVEEVYNQMEKEIDEAIKYFKNAKPRPKGDPKHKSQININAAYGMKARITLSKGNWQVAAEAAKEARNGFPLLDKEDWLSGFNTNNLSEVIWGGNVISTETTYYRSYFYLISPTFNGSQNRSNPKIFNIERFHQIPDTDYRKQAILPIAPNTNSSASNGQGGSYTTDPNYDTKEAFDAAKASILSKYGMTRRHNTHPYMHVKFLQKNPGTIDPDDVIYMRASEMYLIEAEAKAMMNDIAGAQAALAPLGSARDSAYDVTVFDTKEKFMEHIKFQRYVELYGEGFGYTDHIRWDMAIDQSNSGASEVLYQQGFKQGKPSTNNDWIFKIPQAEIDANPNISEADQN